MAHTTTENEWEVVGERIRDARERSGMSVRELARRIEVSASHVSQVERGLASFSVRALYNVVSILGISMDSLFESDAEAATGSNAGIAELAATAQPGPLDEAGIVQRGALRPAIQLDSGPRWERLTPKPEVGVEFIQVVYRPNPGGQPPEDYIRHGGREYGIIISGVLNVQVGFGEATLYPGDSIAFDCSIPHRFWNQGAEEVVAVWFVMDEPHEEDRQFSSDSPAPH
jgi:transcriptional regulator with XRE-family HTH domain